MHRGTVRAHATRLVLGLALCALQPACDDDEGACCGPPPMLETDVAFTWTVNGSPAAEGCAAAGAATVRLEVHASDVPAHVEVPCEDGEGTLRATVFGPALGTMSAGVGFARLQDDGGVELSARHAYLVWSRHPDDGGTVSPVVALVTAPPGGSLRFRWCEPIAEGTSHEVVADGPMWKAQVAAAGATEVLFPALPPGRYRVRRGEPPMPEPVWGLEADVVEGQETLVTVYPCPLQASR